MEDVIRSRRLPKNHQLVFDVVSSQPVGVHAPAGLIFAAARQRQPGIGHSTVYRALDRLCDMGLIHEVRVPGAASSLYEVARAGHAHFRCEGCGQVDDIDYHLPPEEIDGLARTKRIAISAVELTFSGLCDTCRLALPRAADPPV